MTLDRKDHIFLTLFCPTRCPVVTSANTARTLRATLRAPAVPSPLLDNVRVAKETMKTTTRDSSLDMTSNGKALKISNTESAHVPSQ